VQYVEGLNGETARRSRVSVRAAEAFMNNAGQVAISLVCICLQGAVMVFRSVYHEPSGDMHVPVAWDALRVSRLFPYRIVAFTLSSLVSWL